MRYLLNLGLACIFTFGLYAGTASAAESGPKKLDVKPRWVGLCVRTARDGFVILEARVVRSSGDPEADKVAQNDVLGSSVPLPNQRMWLEWLPMGVSYDLSGGDTTEPMTFDCAELEREALASAKAL